MRALGEMAVRCRNIAAMERFCADVIGLELMAPVDGQPIACTKQRRLGHGIWQGRCTLADGTDPALVLLAEGLAEAAADAPDGCRAASDGARQGGLGMFGS